MWQFCSEEIGGLGQAYDPMVSVETIETLLTQSERLEDSEWSFTTLRNHNYAEEYDGVTDGAYVLEVPDGELVAVPESIAETAQAEFGAADGVVVTFQLDVAEEYPSIRLLLPGDPLFNVLSEVTAEGDAPTVKMICGRDHNGTPEVTVGSVGDDIKSADVVAPATTNESVTDLLGAGSLEPVEDTEKTVLDWLSSRF